MTFVGRLFCLAIATSALGAQTTWARGVSLGASAGIWSADDAYKIDTKPFSALALGYRFDSGWALDGSYLQSEADLNTAPGGAQFDQLRLDLLYQMHWNERLLPYLLVGVGRQSIEVHGREVDNDLAAAAVGADWRLTARLSLRGELRSWQDRGYDTINHSFALGLRWQLGSMVDDDAHDGFDPLINLDSDGDAVRDRSDRCLDTPAGAEVDAYGCEMTAADKARLAP